jgi:enoyl-CoA hydratase / 3-hydroxyacyl-CoA dehydrogenase
MVDVASLSKRGVAVVGAGNMGAGIAQRIAQEGIPVFLLDQDMALAEAGKNKIAALLEEAVARRIFNPERVARILEGVTPTSDVTSVRDAGLVIEAIFEDRETKRGLFAELDAVCAVSTVFATNTSSLSIAELGEASGRPDRFGGLHFFYHPAKNRLLEVISGPATSAKTARFLLQFGRTIGKTCIRVADRSGFAVNRFFVPWLNEAVRMFDEGAASVPTIEAAARQAFGIGMGPFELMNVTGVAIAYHSAETLAGAIGPFYAPSESLRERTESRELWDLEGPVDSSALDDVSDRLRGCVFGVAAALVEEGVAGREDTDRGATVGLRWREGPFAMMNRAGTAESWECVRRFVERYPSLGLPSSLGEVASARTPWPLSFVDLRVHPAPGSARGGIARITVNRPEALNALSPVVMDQLTEALATALAMPGVETIIFDGVGKAFVAGADLRFFVDALKDRDFDRTYRFTAKGHALFDAIASSEKRTVALIDGLALGGGAEMALACDRVVVTPRAHIAFPETGIGIYPGLGGTQRLPRKIGRSLARYFVLCGIGMSADDAMACGFADAFLEGSGAQDADAEAAEVAALAGGDAANQTPFDQARTLFAQENIEALLSGELPAGTEATALTAKVLKLLSRKAPIALRMAADLIEDGYHLPLADGLQLELEHLEAIFSTEDALEGLSSAGKRRPQFTGR